MASLPPAPMPMIGFGRSSPYRQNRSYMDYLRKIANRIAAEQILEEEQQVQAAPQAEFTEQSYLTQPEMPYLSELSPMARYKDMGLRDQGRQFQAGQAIREAAAETALAQKQMRPTLMEDVSMGVTRQPDGRVVTQGGGTIYNPVGPMAGRTLTSPYGTGSSSPVGTGKPGTFSFTAADGTVVQAPFSSLHDPKFMKFMREEELGRAAGSTPQKKKPSVASFEDIMAQIDSAK
jgi:hypothetical protein